jgi:hypothetical protein
VEAGPGPSIRLDARPCPGLQYGEVRTLVPGRARLSEVRAGLESLEPGLPSVSHVIRLRDVVEFRFNV